jgi:transketolase
MGFGFPAAVGFALSKKLKGEEGKVYCLMSDGELAIGTTWESALIASHHKLDNLTVIVDANHFQAMGPTNQILNLNPLSLKFMALDWETYIIEGHSYIQIEAALEQNTVLGRPKIIIANTIKGKGVPFMENDNLWHYAQIKESDYLEAMKCLI